MGDARTIRPDPDGPGSGAPDHPVSPLGGAAGGEASGQPPRLVSLVNGWWLGTLIAAYAVAFWVGVSDLSGEAANYPRTVIVALLLFVAWGFVADALAWRRGERDTVEDDDLAPDADPSFSGVRAVWERWYKTAATALLSAALVAAIPRAGFYESAFFFLAILFWILGIRRPALLLPLVLGVMVVSWLLFAVALDVRIPAGPLIG